VLDAADIVRDGDLSTVELGHMMFAHDEIT
jgi:hypothetical protein